jgi:two-component system, sensor histidine kinase and response regulator
VTHTSAISASADLLAALSEGVVIIDAAGIVEAMNDAGERILGASRARMVGAVLLELPWHAFEADGSALDRAEHPIIRALRSGEPQPERLLRYRRPDGSERWIATAARPLRTLEGHLDGAVSSFRDVTDQRAAEAALRASEQQYRALFENNASVQLLVDASSGVIRGVNPAAVQFYGFPEEELIGQHVSALSRLDPSTVKPIAEGIVSGKISVLRRRQFRKDGEAREVEVYASPVSIGGQLVLHAIMIDVTSRIEAEEGLRKLGAILDQTPDVVGMFGLDGQLFYTNRAGREMLGLPPLPSGANGVTVNDIPHDALRNSHGGDDADRVLKEGTAVAAEKGVWSGETTLRAPDGSLRVMSQVVLAHRGTDGAVSHFSSVLHDVTAMRNAETLLRDQAQKLEVQTEELTQQTDELLAARDAAESANAAKSQFLAHMSHELRTPLTAIIGFSRVLKTNRRGTLSEQEATYAERVSTNAIRLLGLIDQLLDLSKVEAGHMEFEFTDVDVVAMVQDVVADLEGRERAPGVALRAEVPPWPAFVNADATRLRQVLVNLVGNAIKFTSEGQVVVAVRALDGVASSLAVRDTGVGIAPEHQASVFEPFAQEDTTITRRFGGTGLGLAISMEYCERMGFTLKVSSVPGEGSTFTIGFKPNYLASIFA